VFNTLEIARVPVARTVAYWQIGRELVEIEQHGEERAEYGTAHQRVATRLARQGSAFRRLGEGSLSADQSASVQKGLDSVEPFCAIPAVPRLVPLRGPDPALERDLEQAIIDRPPAFLLEMGKASASSPGSGGSPSRATTTASTSSSITACCAASSSSTSSSAS